MKSKPVVGRFAPSPSGRMHLGNVYAALLSWLSARAAGGKWIVRIEDLDAQRCRREYASKILDDLCYLGLEWDGDVVFQSERTDFYKAAFDRLFEKGLLYPCFCSRADLRASSAPHSSDGVSVYAGTCRALSKNSIVELTKNRLPCWRIRVFGESSFEDAHYGFQKIALESESGDFVIRRADGNFSYQLAVTVDDAAQGVTEVVRGRDLLLSAHRQIFLYRALNETPPTFSHAPLLVSNDGRRLSKRERDFDMEKLRIHFSKEEIIGKILFLCGFLEKEKAVSLSKAVDLFDWKKLPKTDIPITALGDFDQAR